MCVTFRKKAILMNSFVSSNLSEKKGASALKQTNYTS